MATQKDEQPASVKKPEVVYKFCDLQPRMVEAWKNIFSQYIPARVQVSSGDIFKEGPAADAIVSPANSFGFMDGGIDMAYSRHFGWQLQERLQKIIREEYNGELLVGQAIILPTFDSQSWIKKDWSGFNEGKPIKYLVSAPTMRVPWEVADTPNAYLAFRAVILAVQEFNKDPKNEPIRSVLVPGLGTAVGRMPYYRCAYQMCHAFEIFEMGLHSELVHPEQLWLMMSDQVDMVEFGNDAKTARKTKSKSNSNTEQSKEKVKSISELRKTLESLAPPDGASDNRNVSLDKGTTDGHNDKDEDQIPSVYDPKEVE